MKNLALKKNEEVAENTTEKKGKTTKEKVEKTFTPEIILGICSPIGSLKEPVVQAFRTILIKDYNYKVETIKLSDFIKLHVIQNTDLEAGHTPSYTVLHNKIIGGNELRTKYKNPSILAEFAIAQIYIDRIAEEKKNSSIPEFTNLTGRRTCYIIDSIKNAEEFLLLKTVYKELFYMIGVFSPFIERRKNLINKKLSEPEALELIETDEYENNDLGQNVRETFSEADFFFRVSKKDENNIEAKVRRYLHLIFGSKIITPMIEEKAMFHAKAASLNSSCLSRQVGAAIIDETGEVIARGWNDVPKFKGNLYREDELKAHRCKDLGYCTNDVKKDELTNTIVSTVFEEINDVITLSNIDLAKIETLRETLTSAIRRYTRIKDLIEYSRAVHAEMHAIIIGSQNTGNKMIGGKLFCTTYPCHNCARHIILAGIKEVYFIEPYVKSLCLELHSDAITEDEKSKSKVKIIPFDGVSPSRYKEFFSMNGKRKSESTIKKIDLHLVCPKSSLTLQALPTLEAQAIHSLTEAGLVSIDEKQVS